LRTRQFLIFAEVALASMLLAGAGLMIRSLMHVTEIGIGFNMDRLMSFDIGLPENRYPSGESRTRYFRTLLERLRSVSGVTDAAAVDNLPLHAVSVTNFYIAGDPEPHKDTLPMSDYAHVSPDYFRTIGLRLLAGRFFSDADLARNENDKGGVAIVNEAFAARFFPRKQPLGQRIVSSGRDKTYEVVGVVADTRPLGVENGTRPQIFYPYLKLPSASIVVRTAAPPESFGRAVRAAAASVDADVVPDRVGSMEQYMREWTGPRKFMTLIFGCFAGIALLLAALGIYGVLSHLVASRTREIGIRMAVGAQPAQIGAQVARQCMIPVAIGLSAGIAGALATGRLMRAVLFEVQPYDALALSFSVAAILISAPAAVWAPLRRATRVDCTVALREE
jgi:putative ABC transport system permease protein